MSSVDPADQPAEKTVDQAPHRDMLFQARDLALGGLFGALGIVLPIAFHAVGPQAGKLFLPMHLPILALGLLSSWQVAVIVGALTPLISGVLTGMPPPVPTGAIMAVELAVLAAVGSLVRRAGGHMWLACIAAILAARGAVFLEALIIGPMLGLNLSAWAYVSAAIVTGIPGILLQLTVVPSAVFGIERASILARRRQRRAAS